ncbi:MAG: replicative DNA helicase [Elusimicrobiota bacterium]
MVLAKTENMVTKLPPQNLEAERAVLGAMLIDIEAIVKAIDVFSRRGEKCFYLGAHQKLYRTIVSLFEENKGVDTLIVSEELRKNGYLEEIGGVVYLTSLIDSVSTSAHIEHYSLIVREKSLLRELISAGTEIVNCCFSQEKNIEDVLDKAEESILNIAQDRLQPGFVPASGMVHELLEKIEKYHRQELITGIPSGYKDFDALTGGLQPGNLIIIAGRPSMGKTSFCLNIAEHITLQEKRPVAVFSLEMSLIEVMMRMLCSEARVNLHQVRRGFLAKSDWLKITSAAARFHEADLFIDQSSSLSVLEMKSRARRLASEMQAKGKRLSLVMVDYLQLMQGRSRAENRQQEISEISRSLKALARELDVPVVALSQLSRRPEEKTRGDHRPQLSDLRESGAIEQDADAVIFIYREEVYRPDDPEVAGKAKIIIGKQRNGPIGEFELGFLKESTKFVDLSKAG